MAISGLVQVGTKTMVINETVLAAVDRMEDHLMAMKATAGKIRVENLEDYEDQVISGLDILPMGFLLQGFKVKTHVGIGAIKVVSGLSDIPILPGSVNATPGIVYSRIIADGNSRFSGVERFTKWEGDYNRKSTISERDLTIARAVAPALARGLGLTMPAIHLGLKAAVKEIDIVDRRISLFVAALGLWLHRDSSFGTLKGPILASSSFESMFDGAKLGKAGTFKTHGEIAVKLDGVIFNEVLAECFEEHGVTLENMDKYITSSPKPSFKSEHQKFWRVTFYNKLVERGDPRQPSAFFMAAMRAIKKREDQVRAAEDEEDDEDEDGDESAEVEDADKEGGEYEGEEEDDGQNGEGKDQKDEEKEDEEKGDTEMADGEVDGGQSVVREGSKKGRKLWHWRQGEFDLCVDVMEREGQWNCYKAIIAAFAEAVPSPSPIPRTYNNVVSFIHYMAERLAGALLKRGADWKAIFGPIKVQSLIEANVVKHSRGEGKGRRRRIDKWAPVDPFQLAEAEADAQED